MNRSGLQAYFGVEDPEEAVDLLDEKLFEIKQHFIAKPWLQLTAKSRLKQLKEWIEFFPDRKPQPVWNMEMENSTVLEWWTAYQRFHNWGKQQVSQADSPGFLHDLIVNLLETEHKFLAQVPNLEYTEQVPVFGTEPDSMQIHREIMQLDSLGICNFTELFEKRQQVSDNLLLACRRWAELINYV